MMDIDQRTGLPVRYISRSGLELIKARMPECWNPDHPNEAVMLGYLLCVPPLTEIDYTPLEVRAAALVFDEPPPAGSRIMVSYGQSQPHPNRHGRRLSAALKRRTGA